MTDAVVPAFLADLIEGDEDPEGSTALEAAVAQLDPAESFVTVSKLDHGAGGGWSQCTRVPVETFDPLQIAREFGLPGRYRFSFRRPNGTIAHTMERRFAAPAHVEPVAPAARPASPDADRVAELERRIEADRQGNQRFMETLLTTLLSRETGGGGGLDARLLMEAIREGRESATGVSPPHALLMDCIKMGTELAGLRGDPNANGSGETMLEKLAPKVLGLLEKGLQGSQVNAGADRSDVHVTPAPPAGMDPVVYLIRQYTPHLIREAQAGHDPEIWAHWLWERTPDTWRDGLLKLAHAEQLPRRSLIAQIEPKLLPHMGWIESVCAFLVDLTTPEETEEATADATEDAEPTPVVDAATPRTG